MFRSVSLLFCFLIIFCVNQCIVDADVMVKFSLTHIKSLPTSVLESFQTWVDTCKYNDILLSGQYIHGNFLIASSIDWYGVYSSFDMSNLEDGCMAANYTKDAKLSMSIVTEDYPTSSCTGYNSNYQYVINCELSECLLSCGPGAVCENDGTCPANMTCSPLTDNVYCSATMAQISVLLFVILSAIVIAYM